MAIGRKSKMDDNFLPNKNDVLAKTSVPFPNNDGRLLSSEYYLQFREWHAVFSTMKSE